MKDVASDVAHGVVPGVLSVPSDGTSHPTASATSTIVLPSPSITTASAHTGAAAATTTGAAQGAITLRTVDFGGQREYLYTHPLFCTSRAVYALCAPLDKLFGKPPAEVVNTLREYASMVQVRAPDAPMVVVFTKADQVPGMTPDAMPAPVTRWVHDVMTALRAEFSQVAAGADDDESTCALVLSSKDGWEASQARVRHHWAQLALASPGAGDTLPASYGKMRDALGVAGAAWKKGTAGHHTIVPCPGDEECKGVEGAASCAAGDATAAAHDSSHPNVPLAMRWGTQVPIVTVGAVRDMAVEHCGLSHDTNIRQPLLLLHHMGCVVYGGALAAPSSQDAHGDADDIASLPCLDLSQLVILDPQWLANMLSRVVTQYARHHDDNGNPIRRGQVSLRDVALAFHGYPDELRGSFLEVLFALEVAFPRMAEGGGVSRCIIVPALLPSVPSNVDEAVTAMLSVRKASNVKVGSMVTVRMYPMIECMGAFLTD